jgi:hypothetical protein
MKLQRTSVFSIILGLAMTGSVVLFSSETRANVYATNIKLNGALNNITNSAGATVTISYILNEPATLGATVNILSGNNIVRSISISPGAVGTRKGTNSVVWDGKDGGGNTVGSGIYNISITAAASGFTNWTQTSTDTNAGYYVFAPRGIAVNTNPNSKYFGRVFVGNAQNKDGSSAPGDIDGILKVNADGSLADEGQSSGGYIWYDDGYDDSPYSLRYGQDDRIYALDFTASGVIVACDMAMTTNQVVLTPNNYSTTSNYMSEGWRTFDVTDAGATNGRLWLGDNAQFFQDGIGVWAWHMTNGVANTNDTSGTQVIALGGALTDDCYGGFMMDEGLNIFVSQQIAADSDPDPRAMVFTNWDGIHTLTNGTAWSVGAGDDSFEYIYDTSISSRHNPAYVAYALSGAAGGIRVLYASDGEVVTNAEETQTLTNLDSPNAYYGVAWDAVGNIYGALVPATTNTGLWRVFSPPGTNQATTFAVETVQIGGTGTTQPVITNIVVNGTTVTIDFTGSVSDSPTSFTVLSASLANGTYTPASGAVISQLSPGHFQAILTGGGPDQFYNVVRSASSSPTAPVFGSIVVNGTSVTLNFTGSSNDVPSAFTLLSSAIAGGPFTNASGDTIIQMSPGHFQAIVTNAGSSQFYRLKR